MRQYLVSATAPLVVGTHGDEMGLDRGIGQSGCSGPGVEATLDPRGESPNVGRVHGVNSEFIVT